MNHGKIPNLRLLFYTRNVKELLNFDEILVKMQNG